jgi:tetratricopeptide (TPR) repeat protein
MKKLIYAICLTILFLFLCANYAALAQNTETEIPITSASETAVQKYIEARMLSEDFQIAKALSLYNEAITLDPDFALAYAGKAFIAGDFKKSTENIDKAVSLSGNVSVGEKYYIAFTKAFIDGDVIKQHETVDKLMELYPSDKRVAFMAAGLHYVTGTYDETVEYLKKAVAIDPKFAPAYNLLGYAYAAQKNYPEAEKSLKTYLSLKPDLPNAYDSYAEILKLEGKYDESITQYKTALEKDPQFTYSLMGLGDNYCLKKDFAKAREYYRKMQDETTLNVWKYNALYNMSLSYVREGNISEALSVLDKRAEIAETNGDIPTVVSSLNAKGFILAESGDPGKAVASFKKALSMIDGSGLSDDMKKNLSIGTNLNVVYGMTMQNKIEAAQDKLKDIETAALNSSNLDDVRMLNFVKGTIALKQDKPEQAIEYFGRAGDENPLAWRYEAIALHKSGDTAKAIELRDKIQTFTRVDLNGTLSVYNFQDLAELEPE